MKKREKLCCILLAALILLSGCGKESVPMEDYVQSNPTTENMNGIMKSDTGFYYCASNRQPLSLHYFDEASGQNIFLCSKPECRHDGDAFCVATGEEYAVHSAYFYGGALYLNVIEKTDTEYVGKLIRVSADGAERTDVVTYLTVNNTSLWVAQNEPMLIHRGVVVLSYILNNMDGEGVRLVGTCFYDLNTGELTEFPEVTVSESYKWFTGYGDYIYYTTRQDKQRFLTRYCLTDGTTEKVELLNNFTGMYEIIDEDTIYYTRSGNTLFEYSFSNNGTVRHDGFFSRTVVSGGNGHTYTSTATYQCSDMMTDGTYFYVGEGVLFRSNGDGYMGYSVDVNGVETPIKSYVHVFDRELNEVATVEIATEYYLDEEVDFSIAILDGIVYLQTDYTVFSCTLEKFLAGEIPPFKPVYDVEMEIWQ